MERSQADREAIARWLDEVLPLGHLGFAQADVDEVGAAEPLGPPAGERAEELFVTLPPSLPTAATKAEHS